MVGSTELTADWERAPCAPDCRVLQAAAWLSSFGISVLFSVVVLQSFTAMVGGLLATVVSTAAVGSAIGALAVGAELMSYYAN